MIKTDATGLGGQLRIRSKFMIEREKSAIVATLRSSRGSHNKSAGFITMIFFPPPRRFALELTSIKLKRKICSTGRRRLV